MSYFRNQAEQILTSFCYNLHYKENYLGLQFWFVTMPKKSSSKKAKQLQENNVVEEEKPSSAQKKASSEIDEIFAGKKRKKSEPEKTEKPNEDVTGNPKKMKKKKKDKESNDNGFTEPPSRPRKRTNDGFTVYREDELGIDKADAGGTALCPFDCSCCF